MKYLITSLGIIMAGLIMMSPSLARAETITFDFSGEVQFADTPTMLFMPGQRYSGQFTFESTTTAVPYSNGYVGYEYAITAFDIQIGDYYIRFLNGPSNIAVVNDIPSGSSILDHYSVNVSGASNQPSEFDFESNLPYTNLTMISMGLDIIDTDQTGNPTMLLNENLPLLPPPLLDAEQALAAIYGEMDEGWIFLDLTVDTLTQSITSVPVPAAVWLFGSGLIGLIGLARRRAK